MDDSVLRVLVVDDSALYRKFVRNVLEDIPNVEVVGTATNGRIALDKIEALKPNLITLDLEMPELDGLGVLRDLSAREIDIASIMISSLTAEGAKTTSSALQLGAFDFVLKPAGKSPEVSHTLLKADLSPKIHAYLGELSRKSTKTQKPSSSAAPSDAIKRMTESVNTMRQQPLIVTIGISTGGPAALNQLLPQLPGDFPCPILLVQHMPPLFTKSLADDLNRLCALEVHEAADGMTVKSGHVYIAPGGSQMRVAMTEDTPTIQITDDLPERNCKPSVDYLFRSVAKHYGNRAVAAVLTGMGDDGTEGCKYLKKAGSMIVTQDEASCVVYGMPRSVYEAGLTDQVASLDDMPARLFEAVTQGALK